MSNTHIFELFETIDELNEYDCEYLTYPILPKTNNFGIYSIMQKSCFINHNEITLIYIVSVCDIKYKINTRQIKKLDAILKKYNYIFQQNPEYISFATFPLFIDTRDDDEWINQIENFYRNVVSQLNEMYYSEARESITFLINETNKTKLDSVIVHIPSLPINQVIDIIDMRVIDNNIIIICSKGEKYKFNKYCDEMNWDKLFKCLYVTNKKRDILLRDHNCMVAYKIISVYIDPKKMWINSYVLEMKEHFIQFLHKTQLTKQYLEHFSR